MATCNTKNFYSLTCTANRGGLRNVRDQREVCMGTAIHTCGAHVHVCALQHETWSLYVFLVAPLPSSQTSSCHPPLAAREADMTSRRVPL